MGYFGKHWGLHYATATIPSVAMGGLYYTIQRTTTTRLLVKRLPSLQGRFMVLIVAEKPYLSTVSFLVKKQQQSALSVRVRRVNINVTSSLSTVDTSISPTNIRLQVDKNDQ